MTMSFCTRNKIKKRICIPPFINIINICLISKKKSNKTANEKYLEVKEGVGRNDKERSRKIQTYSHNIYKLNNE